jgi:hypothetical protein
MQKNGFNFNKEEYDCFTSYLDFNAKNKISNEEFAKFIKETEK